ncbi:MAG: class I SAM-dependent methyltransferase [Terriglobales bacterium]
MTDNTQPTTRFSNRVDDYVKARPGYPAALITTLVEDCRLEQASMVVDVGCGTGLLAARFCEFGSRVIGVEPNAEMRAAGEQYLARYSNFQMMNGTAECIGLPAGTAEFISAGQAFHWFDVNAARREFLRVLKPQGWVVLVWNDRVMDGSKFAGDYEQLLVRFGIDYASVHHRGKATPENFRRFFGDDAFVQKSFPNAQQLDYDQFVARVLSSSYMPPRGHAQFEPMMNEVRRVFGENATGSRVTMEYATSATYGHLSRIP